MAKLKANLDTSGDASLQNAIQLAVDSLSTVPPYGHREVRSMQLGIAKLSKASRESDLPYVDTSNRIRV